MAYRITPILSFPLQRYQVNGSPFGKNCVRDGVHWGAHLGEDCLAPVGTEVRACGRGTVVYSDLHIGSEAKGNWGNIIIIAHKHPRTRRIFHTLYAHLGARFREVRETVEAGDVIGYVGKGQTPENGFWEEHLHFAVYVGPWKHRVLPGYWKEGETRTRPEWWRNPSDFIRGYADLKRV